MNNATFCGAKDSVSAFNFYSLSIPIAPVNGAIHVRAVSGGNRQLRIARADREQEVIILMFEGDYLYVP